MDGKKYPARLVDMPCVLETQKTLDKRTFFKSGDVGQMLIVYKVSVPPISDRRSISMMPSAGHYCCRYHREPCSTKEDMHVLVLFTCPEWLATCFPHPLRPSRYSPNTSRRSMLGAISACLIAKPRLAVHVRPLAIVPTRATSATNNGFGVPPPPPHLSIPSSPLTH